VFASHWCLRRPRWWPRTPERAVGVSAGGSNLRRRRACRAEQVRGAQRRDACGARKGGLNPGGLRGLEAPDGADWGRRDHVVRRWSRCASNDDICARPRLAEASRVGVPADTGPRGQPRATRTSRRPTLRVRAVLLGPGRDVLFGRSELRLGEHLGCRLKRGGLRRRRGLAQGVAGFRERSSERRERL